MREFSLKNATESRSESRDEEENEDSMDRQTRQSEEFLISSLRPEFNYICSNPIRASIIHMLVGNKDLGHTMQVEEIARRLGKRHSVVIYHLERLTDWKIVKIVKSVEYGDTEKRTIWGLNIDYPDLIREIYSRVLKFFFTQKELDKMCSINRNVRNVRNVRKQ